MDFEFSEDQKLLMETARKFSESVIAPSIAKMRSQRRIPEEVYSEMARMGYLGMTVPEKFGGMGADAVSTGIVAEQIARSDPTASIPVLFLVDNAWSYLISKYGKEEVFGDVLRKVAKGQWITAIASTESGHGSDVAGIDTTAKRSGDEYIVNGEKSFISLVRDVKEHGGGFVTVVKTKEGAGSKGISLLYVPYSDDIEISYLEEMGREGSSWGVLRFNDLHVPSRYLIGEENHGFNIVHEGFEFARGLISVISAGTALKSIENGINYMKQRKAFGREIATYEGLQFQVADDVAKMEAALNFAYRSLWIYDQEQRYGRYSRFYVSKNIAMAKLISTTWGFDAINDAMQWQGAYGYSKDCPEEWALRGIRSFMLAEGSREIMKLIVARESIGKEYLR
ncbi:acyl-CoA dehydrogenase [Thermoplasma sp. Kam2015]|uniref:acyl-CoA dehydrogenase family protein n=1 Tax=Thermoplasma sp. Kam2015 TaxID=2094122 RepID=UPI000D82CE11|nr:acyl-CoA dehydrogenase family protein [Thermoplasma sp. Kam2015]PYB68683.1 acyl-CoA dehydrogenase [Thermoplasma sp. Kam2015]